MPEQNTLAARIAGLNKEYRGQPTRLFIEQVLHDPRLGRIALVSSFGAESAVLLHLVARVNPAIPVLFIDTGKLFPETLAYQQQLTDQLGLTDLRILRPDPEALAALDADGILHQTAPNTCCELRKVRPLQQALGAFDAWISGRKRFQSDTRADLDYFENEQDQRIKINPLAHWTPDELEHYRQQHQLPAHPLVAQGYRSIGCAPCTSPVDQHENSRAGRWRHSTKHECGIHFVNGRIQRLNATPISQAA
ncbi:MAG: phosphoadenylyl-sulfate reductase [Pseudomonadota bacterium]